MSLENAILDHAAALREVAAAVMALVGRAPQTLPTAAKGVQGTTVQDAAADVIPGAKGKNRDGDTAEHVQTKMPTVEQREEQKKAQAKAAAKEKADADKAAAEAASVAKKLEEEDDADLVGGETETEVFDFDSDVAPLITKLIKKDRAAVVALLAQYGAKNGAGLKATDYPAVVGKINKLLAA